MIESTGLACQRLICDLVSTRLPKSYGYDPVRDIQVLCPTKVGPTGSVELNRRLQAILNPPAPDKPQIIWEQSGRVLRCGDKVMQIKTIMTFPMSGTVPKPVWVPTTGIWVLLLPLTPKAVL